MQIHRGTLAILRAWAKVESVWEKPSTPLNCRPENSIDGLRINQRVGYLPLLSLQPHHALAQGTRRQCHPLDFIHVVCSPFLETQRKAHQQGPLLTCRYAQSLHDRNNVVGQTGPCTWQVGSNGVNVFVIPLLPILCWPAVCISPRLHAQGLLKCPYLPSIQHGAKVALTTPGLPVQFWHIHVVHLSH